MYEKNIKQIIYVWLIVPVVLHIRDSRRYLISYPIIGYLRSLHYREINFIVEIYALK